MKLRLREKTTATLLIALFFATMIPMVMAPPAGKGVGGFDEWGYNYMAHLFNGDYDLYNRDQNELTPGYEIHLTMWWNEAWLSKTRERPDEYIGSGAWLTNHMVGTDDETGELLFTYFVKIVAQDYEGHAESIGAEEIWGAFMIIQQVSNDPDLDEHGILTLVTPAGFGCYQP